MISVKVIQALINTQHYLDACFNKWVCQDIKAYAINNNTKPQHD